MKLDAETDNAPRRCEATWRRYESRPWQLFECLPHVVWMTALDGGMEFMNSMGLKLLGRTAEQVHGLGWQDALHVDDREMARRAWLRTTAHGEPHLIEYRLRTVDGRYRWHLAQAVAMRDAEGRIEHWVGTWTDVDDEKRAQIEKRETEIRYRSLLNSVPMPLFIYDAETWMHLAVNEAALIEYGYSQAEFRRMTIMDLCAAQDASDLMGALPRSRQGYKVLGQWRQRKKDGSLIDVEITTHEIELSGQRACVTLANNVTHRKQADEELRFRDRAIQAVTQGIVIADAVRPDYPMVYASPGFERLTGFSQAEALGHNCRLLQGPDTDPEAIAKIRAAIRDRQPCVVELLNYRKDGTTFWNQLALSPLYDDRGRVTHFVGTQTDITDRRQLAEQFRQSQRMEAVGQLAGGVAHDFNNLLTIVNGNAELLLDSAALDDSMRESLEEIKNAGERSAALTGQLLAFSRQQMLSPKVLNLNHIVENVDKMLRRVIGEDVVLATHLDSQLGHVVADPGQIEQVLLNLVVNARDAMPQGGKITIATRGVELSQTFVQSRAQLSRGRYVLLAVSDTGKGMSPETRQRVFEPFFTTKELGKGTGLGLAVVHGIVLQSGGHIEVESQLGVGTTFTVYLPLVAAAATVDESRSIENVPRGSETILLVEDEAGVRAVARRVLEGCGYTVLEASHGEAAWKLSEQRGHQFDLLLTDVVMPKLGGARLAQRLLEANPRLRVLFVSGYTDDAVVRHGIWQEQVNYLPKPFTTHALALAVRTVLDASTAA